MGGTLKCLGTGPGKTQGDRYYSAYLYHFGQTGILVDCGEPLSLTFKREKLDPDAFDLLLITHTHPDHIGGFLSFLQALKHLERQRPLDIFLPGHAIPALKALLDAAYLFPERLPFSFEFQKLEAGRAFRAGGVKITPFATSHLDGLQQKVRKHRRGFPAEAFAFLFQHENRYVVHSGDLGSEQDLLPLLEHPLDLLVAELAHSEPADLFQLIAEHSVKKVAFVHLKEKFWRNRRRLAVKAGRILPARVFFPKDGDKLKF
jgi:ribonuclease BN (tRNA processing enzyme)